MEGVERWEAPLPMLRRDVRRVPTMRVAPRMALMRRRLFAAVKVASVCPVFFLSRLVEEGRMVWSVDLVPHCRL